LGGGIHSGPNLVDLGKVCEWFQCDNQGRGGDDTPVWGCALQGRVCNAVQNGKMATNVTGAWSTGTIRWRNVSKSMPEAEMWLDATVASGMVPYWHFIGAENGLGEDSRWHEPGKQFFDWTAKHDQHFVNKSSIAKLGVVMGQRAHLFYDPPHGAAKGTYMTQAINGMYYALLEGRFFFDFVHEDKLEPEQLSKYTALVLPNTALLSDKQCQQLRAYVDAGGLLARIHVECVGRELGGRVLRAGRCGRRERCSGECASLQKAAPVEFHGHAGLPPQTRQVPSACAMIVDNPRLDCKQSCDEFRLAAFCRRTDDPILIRFRSRYS